MTVSLAQRSWTLSDGAGTKTVYVRFRDSWGNESLVATDTIDLVPVEPTALSIDKAKESPDGTVVYIGKAAVTASFSSFFYIESDNRSSGIRVEGSAEGISSGTRANITGTMATNMAGERYVAASDVAQTPPPDDKSGVLPVAMVVDATGGGDWRYRAGEIWPETLSGQKGIEGGRGINTIGILVRVSGRITGYEDAESPSWFIIDDGSREKVKCIIPSGISFDKSWSYATVTGVCSTEMTEGKMKRVILIRDGIIHY
jgi:hypothetical protein